MAVTNALLASILIMLCAIAGALVAPPGRQGTGALAGLFLGPLGMAMAAQLMTPEQIAHMKRATAERRQARAAAKAAPPPPLPL